MKTILRPGRNAWKRARTGRAGLVLDGRDYYHLFWQAARGARRFLCIAGWQMDSRVRLLRGEDAESAGTEAPLLEFLEECCRRRESLQVYILAWDFSVLYSLDREAFQQLRFKWGGHQRIHFRFDSTHPVGASHHQKLVIADNEVAFVGGMDLCGERWDRASHEEECDQRIDPRGRRYGPYHDVQALITGSAVRVVTRIFRQRWHRATGKALRLPRGEGLDAAELEPTLAIRNREVCLSRTMGRMITPQVDPVEEIGALYVDAIRFARFLIYIENQYLTSRDVVTALRERLKDAGAPSIEIVVILPPDPENKLERMALVALQVKYMDSLRKLVQKHGHRLGVYYVGAGEKPVYIHSKLMMVDDRFLTVGSANTTNRSMGLDTELNLSWETTDPGGPLAESLREVRVALLGHLAGLPDPEREPLRGTDDLVEFLDREAEEGRIRLRPYQEATSRLQESSLVKLLPEGFHLDPAHPATDPRFWETQFWTGD